ncbi:hypothetical protein MCEMIH15_02816 [Caulobacteraceae bacterium]|jgi:hypothetical protein
MGQFSSERGLLEIIDRAQLILTSWQAFVEEHPETQLHPALVSISDEVTDLMAAFYLEASEMALDQAPVSGLATDVKMVKKNQMM